MKKKLLHVLCAALPALGLAQVAINKPSVSNSSVSLEFGNQNKALLLPWVDNPAAVTGAVPGTIIYDFASKKVKVKSNASGSWQDLSVDDTGTADNTIQASKTDLPNAKVSIGTKTSTPGLLVLEDNNKAMVLPLVNQPHLNIKNPAAGMMVFDTNKKQLGVFNGTNWTFWKE
jgi:hypothetical protein